MRKLLLLLAMILPASVLVNAQDIGISEIRYPVKTIVTHELTTVVPVYYTIKNYGSALEGAAITVKLIPETSSPGVVSFTANVAEDGEVLMDAREQSFYQNGLSQVPGIGGVLRFQTPEASAGDTIDVCVVATVEDDVNTSNDTMCFEVILAERQPRDLGLEIVQPNENDEVKTWEDLPIQLTISNGGDVDYTRDSLFMQLQIVQGQSVLDQIGFAVTLDSDIAAGSSATIDVNLPIGKAFPVGQTSFCLRVSWLSQDLLVELAETNFDNNDDCVAVNVVANSIDEISANSSFYFDGSQIIGQIDEKAIGKNVRIALYSMEGKLLYQNELDAMPAQIQIPVNNHKGIHLLRVELDGEIFSKKVLVR